MHYKVFWQKNAMFLCKVEIEGGLIPPHFVFYATYQLIFKALALKDILNLYFKKIDIGLF